MNTNKAVIQAFLRKERLHSGNLLSDGNKLFSYNTIIAQWIEPYILRINTTRYSNTTSRHLGILRNEMNESDLDRVEEVYDIPIDTQTL